MHDAHPGRAELWGLCGLRRGARGAWACGRAWGAEALLKTHIKRPSSMSYVCGVWRFYGLLGWPRGEGLMKLLPRLMSVLRSRLSRNCSSSSSFIFSGCCLTIEQEMSGGVSVRRQEKAGEGRDV